MWTMFEVVAGADAPKEKRRSAEELAAEFSEALSRVKKAMAQLAVDAEKSR